MEGGRVDPAMLRQVADVQAGIYEHLVEHFLPEWRAAEKSAREVEAALRR